MSRVPSYPARPKRRAASHRTPLITFVLHPAERIVAGVALLASAPLIGLLAVAVRLDSNGPVIERERRTGGRGGRIFDRYRFRTTVEGASTVAHLRISGVMGVSCERVTRAGRLLRATRLYRLPRLVNVVAGDDRLSL